MVLTHPDHRRLGFARRLLTTALSLAAQRGIQTVKLDATNQGQPLYESLGFRAEQEIQRWSREPASITKQTAPHSSSWTVAQRLDEEAFCVDRSRLFTSVRNRARLYGREDGFISVRPGSRATYLGPFVAHNLMTASHLMEECLTHEEGPCFWDILPANHSAVALARETGFRLERSLVRMFRGAGFRHDSSMTYGIAGFEFG